MQVKDFIKNNTGIAAVEFAFIAPILLTLLIGTVDIGLYLNDKMKLEAISRAAAEYLIVSRDEDGVMEKVITPYYDAQGEVNWEASFTFESDFVCECEGGIPVECALGICEDEGDYKRRFYDVNVTKTHKTLFVYPGFPSTIDLEGSAKMQLD